MAALTIILVGLLVYVVFQNFYTPKVSDVKKTDAPATQTQEPSEKWTDMPPEPLKQPSIAVGRNNNLNYATYGTFFTRRNNTQESLKTAIKLGEKGPEVTPTGSLDSEAGLLLNPWVSLYSNWEENPKITPKLVDWNQEKVLLLEPANDNSLKSRSQTENELYLIYKIPDTIKNKPIVITLRGRELSIDSNGKGAETQKEQDGPTQDGAIKLPNYKAGVTESNIEANTNISARFINTYLVLKNRFSPESPKEGFPKIMAAIKFETTPTIHDKYLEIKIETSRGVNVFLNPTISIKPKQN